MFFYRVEFSRRNSTFFFCLLCFLAPSIVANDLDSQTSDSGPAFGRQRAGIWETTGRHLGDDGAAFRRQRAGI